MSTSYTEVRVVTILSNNQVYCSDGVVRTLACSRRLAVGERVIVRGDLIYGHEWRKPAPVLEPLPGELKPCPENSILLIVRISDGAHSHKYYFCMTLVADPVIIELSGLKDPRLQETGLSNIKDIEVTEGIDSPRRQTFEYITRQATVYFLLGTIFKETVHGYCAGMMAFYAERRPFLNINPWANNMDGLPQPNPWILFRAGSPPPIGERQDTQLDTSLLSEIFLTADTITTVDNSIGVHDFIVEGAFGVWYDVCVFFNKPMFKQCNYDGNVLYEYDITQLLKGYYGTNYPFVPEPEGGDARLCGAGYTPVAIIPEDDYYLLYVLQSHIEKPPFGRYIEYLHKFKLELNGNLTYLAAFDETQIERPGNIIVALDDYHRTVYWMDNMHLSVHHVDVWESGASWPKIYKATDTITFTFYDLVVNVVGIIYWYRSWTHPQSAEHMLYTCNVCPLAWERVGSNSFIVYGAISVIANEAFEEIINGVSVKYFYFTDQVKNYLKATTLEPDLHELRDSEGSEIVSLYTFRTYHTSSAWTRTWSCSGREVRNVCISTYGNIILISYLVVSVSRSMGTVHVEVGGNVYTTGECGQSESMVERVFAFYDSSKPPEEALIWRGKVEQVPDDEYATVGFLMAT